MLYMPYGSRNQLFSFVRNYVYFHIFKQFLCLSHCELMIAINRHVFVSSSLKIVRKYVHLINFHNTD
jgi:hypothetical protein